MKIKNSLLAFFLSMIILKAQDIIPPRPENGENATGPGGLQTPIDQYIPFLLVAVLVITSVYLWNKYKSKLIA